MPDRLFPIFGDKIAPMIGRASIMERLTNNFTGRTPAHLQLVGARFSGKTVVIYELVRRLRQQQIYEAIVAWDVGHRSPVDDNQFMQRLAKEIAEELKVGFSAYAEHLNSDPEMCYQNICEVLDAFGSDFRLLLVCDGFDRALSNGNLTRNLWDQLRELAQRPSLRLLTASRRTLRELIRHPEAQTSDLWNIFDPTPVRIGCFNSDSDFNDIKSRIPTVSFAAGAKTELFNTTNGFPVFVLEVLNEALPSSGGNQLTQEHIKAASASALNALSDPVSTLWDECSASCRDVFSRLSAEGAVPRTRVAATDVDALTERGFAQIEGARLTRPNRILQAYLEGSPHESQAMSRLFGQRADYEANLRSVIQKRIEQISDLDPDLRRYLQRGAEDLPSSPAVFLSNVHGILERSLSLIWSAEFGGQKIPSDNFAVWRRNGERGIDDWLTRFPEGGQRLRLLDLITGTQKSDRSARYVTKNMYALANSVQGFRDFGVHPKDAVIELGTAYAALMACVELAACVVRELPPQQAP